MPLMAAGRVVPPGRSARHPSRIERAFDSWQSVMPWSGLAVRSMLSLGSVRPSDGKATLIGGRWTLRLALDQRRMGLGAWRPDLQSLVAELVLRYRHVSELNLIARLKTACAVTDYMREVDPAAAWRVSGVNHAEAVVIAPLPHGTLADHVCHYPALSRRMTVATARPQGPRVLRLSCLAVTGSAFVRAIAHRVPWRVGAGLAVARPPCRERRRYLSSRSSTSSPPSGLSVTRPAALLHSIALALCSRPSIRR